jgi:uncharacterized membrane protein HdeD (DUF308 family)
MSATARNRPGDHSPPMHDEAAVASAPRTGPVSVSRPVPRRAYYIYLARATFALALGVALLLSGSGLSNVATFIAVYWILAAVITLRWVGAHHEARERRIGFVAGGLALVAGVALALRHPLQGVFSQAALLDFFGATAIAMGVLRLSGQLHDDQLGEEDPRRRYRVVAGLLDVVLGVVLLTASERTSTGIRLAVAAWALSTGTLLLLDGLMLRRFAGSQREVET